MAEIKIISRVIPRGGSGASAPSAGGGGSRLLLTYRESWISQYGTLHSSCTMMILMILKN